MNFHRLFQLFVMTAAVSLLAVCSSVPDEIEEGLSPMEYFQRAQEASDDGRYALSMAYYEKFQEQYPEERDRNVWAEYEIALLPGIVQGVVVQMTTFASITSVRMSS